MSPQQLETCEARQRRTQRSTYLKGGNRRTSTKEDSLQAAKDFAEDWYFELRGKAKAGLLKDEKTFKDVAEQFLSEYEVIIQRGKEAQNGLKGMQ